MSYGYDAPGREVSQTSGGATTNYLWDEASPNGDIVLETDAASGAVQASYTLDGQGTLLAQTRGGATRYALPDGQGSVRALADSGGAITDRYSCDAFGNLTSSQGTTAMPYGYDGQRLDASTGLYQLRARDYDPTTGRFLSRDMAMVNLADPVELDRYVYTQDDPINLTDPTGLQSVEEWSFLSSLARIDAFVAGVGVYVGEVLLAVVVALAEFCVAVGTENCAHLVAAGGAIFASVVSIGNALHSLDGAGGGGNSGGGGGGGGGGGSGGGGSGGSQLSALVIQTGRETAQDQLGSQFTAGRLVVESDPDTQDASLPLPFVSPLLKGQNAPPGHAEEQAIGWAMVELAKLRAKQWIGNLVITVITGVTPCTGQHLGYNCQLNFPKWATNLRAAAAQGGISVEAVRDLYWSSPRSNVPAGWWNY